MADILDALKSKKAAHDERFWLGEFRPYAEEVNRLRAMFRALKSGELELWQIEPAEHGGIDIVPAPNPIPTVTAPAPPPAANGAKDAKPEKGAVEVKS